MSGSDVSPRYMRYTAEKLQKDGEIIPQNEWAPNGGPSYEPWKNETQINTKHSGCL